LSVIPTKDNKAISIFKGKMEINNLQVQNLIALIDTSKIEYRYQKFRHDAIKSNEVVSASKKDSILKSVEENILCQQQVIGILKQKIKEKNEEKDL